MLQNSININLQKGYANNDALVDQVKLAKLYFDKNDLVNMNGVLQQIKAELDTIPDNDRTVERAWNRLMWQYFNRLHDSSEAYKYLLTYEVMNDSFIAHNKLLIATDVDERIRNMERQSNINLLKRNNQLEQYYLIIALAMMFMAIIIIGLVLRNARKTKKNLAILTSLNNQVNDQKEKLQIALTELEWKDKDRARILKSVAHDVMNPISSIMALTDILISSTDTYNEEQRELFSLIKEACNNSLNLSKSILEASADHTGLTREMVDINKLVASSVELLSFRAIAKKQHLLITGNDKNVQAFVNKEKIWRVINNLIGNAIKFSHDNSDIIINIQPSKDKVDISVKDNGIGIPEKNKPYVFDMFTEARSLGTSGEEPHGLGLSISLQIAKAHYGTIWFESEEGKGSTFHLVLPLNTHT
jgi:signal transduction histidine kinase